MSHFSVLVTGPDVKTQLAPYEERGDDHTYLADTDITKQARAEYAKSTKLRLQNNVTGELVDPFDEDGAYLSQFCRNRELYVPPGFTELYVPSSQCLTELEWALNYYEYPIFNDNYLIDGVAVRNKGAPSLDEKAYEYGYIKATGAGKLIKVVKRHNPNAKWDWFIESNDSYSRWQERFELIDGSRSSMTTVGQVNWAKMMIDAQALAGEYHDRALAVKGDRSYHTWRSLIAEATPEGADWPENMDVVRAQYHNQESRKDLLADQVLAALSEKAYFNLDETLVMSRDDYVRLMGLRSIATYALLHDGVWYEPGKMGWFGVSSETPETELAYLNQYADIVLKLPENTPISVVDCHI